MTATREELLALALRCEGANGPDRELDADIRLTVAGDCTYGALTGNKHQVIGWGTLSGYVEAYREILTTDDALEDEVVRRYTGSIDAALSLVPEEFGRPSALNVQRSRNFGCHATVWVNSEFNRYVNGKGFNPALALCAAALRALAQESQP